MCEPDHKGLDDAIVFRSAPVVNALCAILFLSMLVGLIWLTFVGASGSSRILGAAGALIFLWCAARSVSSLLRGRGVVLVVGGQGVLDRRVSESWIPWNAVRQVDRVLGGLAIQVEPEFMSGFAEKPLARINRLANEACGYPGIPISVLGVGAKVDQIIEALNRYFPNRVKTSANDVRT